MKTMNTKKWTAMLMTLVLMLTCSVALAGEGQYFAEAPAVTISPIDIVMGEFQVPLSGPEQEGEGDAQQPEADLTADPTAEPEAEPAAAPEADPTAEPTAEPVADPTAEPAAAPEADPTAEPTAEPTEEPVPEVQPSVIAFADMPRVLAEGDAFALESIVENTGDKQVSYQWQFNDGTDANEDGIADWYDIGNGAASLEVETTTQNLKTNWRLVCTIGGTDYVVNAVIKAHHKVIFRGEDGAQIGKTLYVETYTNMARRAPAAPELEGRDFLGWEGEGLEEIRSAATFTAKYSVIVEETEPEETPAPSEADPTEEPAAEPTEEPTAEPTEEPTAEPTEAPEELEPKVVLSYTAPDIIAHNDVIVLTATLFGFEGKELSLQWQYTNEAGEWVDASGDAQGLTYSFHPTLETIDAHWRIVVTVVE